MRISTVVLAVNGVGCKRLGTTMLEETNDADRNDHTSCVTWQHNLSKSAHLALCVFPTPPMNNCHSICEIPVALPDGQAVGHLWLMGISLSRFETLPSGLPSIGDITTATVPELFRNGRVVVCFSEKVNGAA